MAEIDVQIRKLERELGKPIQGILRGILPIKALQDIGDKELDLKFDVCFTDVDEFRTRSIPSIIYELQYKILLDQESIGTIAFHFKKTDKKWYFTGAEYYCDVVNKRYDANSSLKELEKK